MPSIAVIETLGAALALYRASLPTLVKRVLPLLALVGAVGFIDLPDSPLILPAVLVVSLVANARGLSAIYRTRFAEGWRPIPVASFALFICVAGYLLVGAGIAAYFLLVPALLWLSATILAPIFALEHRQGPFEAVASSAELTRGNVLRIMGAGGLYWSALLLFAWAISSVREAAGVWAPLISYLGFLALSLAGFYHYAVAVVLFERLHPGLSAARTPATAPCEFHPRHARVASGAPRSTLPALTAAGLVLVLGGVAWMLMASLRPSAATSASWHLDVDLSSLAPGELRRIDWHGTEILALRRTPEQIEWLRHYAAPTPGEGAKGELPSPAFANRYRSLSPEYLVVGVGKNGRYWEIPEHGNVWYWCDDFRYTTDPIRVSEEITFPGGFYCASSYGYALTDFFRSPYVFDPAGRTQDSWHLPLIVPAHRFDGQTLILGPPG